jgi:hypothetical protein
MSRHELDDQFSIADVQRIPKVRPDGIEAF